VPTFADKGVSRGQRINTRYNSNLHLPLAKLTLYQKGVFYAGSRIYNYLLSVIKDLSNDGKHFKEISFG